MTIRKEQEKLEALLLERLQSEKSLPLTKTDWKDIRTALYAKLAEGNQR